MELRRLRVEGYRSLVDVEIPFGPVTVLLGGNGTGKTNLYRALRLAHAAGVGDLARRVALEGGMRSITHAGWLGGAPKVDLAVELEGLAYELTLATAGVGASFPDDPVIKAEKILLPGTGKRPVAVLDRAGSTAFVRDDDGNEVTYPATLSTSEAAIDVLASARHTPELAYVRNTLASMRFHHQLRTDDEAPARGPCLATRTLAVADDGTDLAAALSTIHLDGDRNALTASLENAFEGARLAFGPTRNGWLELGLTTGELNRPMNAMELSDGQLRFLFLAAVLLAPRPPGVVVLNEPETSLHANLLPSLATLVAAAAERTQVVLTTHAATLATALLEHEETVGVELTNQDGRTTATVL